MLPRVFSSLNQPWRERFLKCSGTQSYGRLVTATLFCLTSDYQELIPHIGPPTKVIPLKLFLDIVPSSSAEITRALGGCFRKGSVNMYVVSENLQRCWDVLFDILITSKGASALFMF